MPRTAPVALGGLVFHVLNRGVARMQLFEKPGDYQAFERVLREIIGRPVTREKLAAIKMPPLSKIARVELPSHIANIGPVPLSSFPRSPGIIKRSSGSCARYRPTGRPRKIGCNQDAAPE
jgi:hypothetical protein